ncbi:3575_t:CDS:2, partial [Cetraspora pellucida]
MSIQTWAKNFADILGSFTKNNCRYLKFHHWIHHTIETIKEYRNLNGLSADTYEALHKQYIKNPYRKSNRRNIDLQILKKGTRILTLKEIYKHIVLQNDKPKINMGKFGKSYCTMPLHLLSPIIELYEDDNECSPEILEGLKQFISTMKDYLNLIPAFEKNIKESEIMLHLYESFTLPNKDQ